MKVIKFMMFILLGGCSISLFRGDVPIIKDEVEAVGAPYPDNPMIGLSFDAISRDRNAIVFTSFQGGYVWKGGAEYISQNVQMGVETKFSYLQGSVNFGIIPFYRMKPYIYPYIGIGIGILSVESYGVYDDYFSSLIYPYLRTGVQLSYPLHKRGFERKTKDFYPSLNFSIGYQFSFERWLQGPYYTVGYSGFFPAEGIFAILIGGLIIFLRG